ncbi:MAG: acetyltransferase [Candidatus Levybacteria bacterium]|nr:acetyltransferase [Candidatus Levybacteria bacterium]
MIIIGAKGHAKEILDVYDQLNQIENLIFFDNISHDLPDQLYGKFKIIRSFNEAAYELKKDSRFVLGIGNPAERYVLARKFINLGGHLESVISPTASIGRHNVILEGGLNLMKGVMISSDVTIGEGTLINAHSSIHHDSRVGRYCEVGPGVRIAGRCTVGDFCSVGIGAILLPDIIIGSNVIVGAGAVVTENIGSNVVIAGVPAKKIRALNPLQFNTIDS